MKKKVIAVFKEPDSCALCPCYDHEVHECNLDSSIEFNPHRDRFTKHKKCPLKPVPEKMDICGRYDKEYYNNGGLVPSAKVGWNMCVDYILGEGGTDEKETVDIS